MGHMHRRLIRSVGMLRIFEIVKYVLHVFARSRLIHQKTHQAHMVNLFFLVTVVTLMLPIRDQSAASTATLTQLA